jgi:hypothetical protein
MTPLRRARIWRNQVSVRLDRCFAQNDFRRAHELSRAVLESLSRDDESVRHVFRACVATPGFLASARINPVIALPVFETARYTLVANCWFPHPTRGTEVSHQSIHHHGNLLLSTVAAHGPGYESFLFERDYEIGDTRRVKDLRLKARWRNARGQYEFVDSYVPHLVFYPPEISVTFALWSRERPRRFQAVSTIVKKLGLGAAAAKAVRALGVARALDVNQQRDLDFAVEEGAFVALQSRASYAPGSNASFLCALRAVGESIGISNAELNTSLPGTEAALEFPDHQLVVPGANLELNEVLRCLR